MKESKIQYILKRIKGIPEEIDNVLKSSKYPDEGWNNITNNEINQIIEMMKNEFPNSKMINEITQSDFQGIGITTLIGQAKYMQSKARKLLDILEEEPSVKVLTSNSTIKKSELEILEKIFLRFHRIATQLRRRYNDRETLDVKDEYDVQDLLHAVLKLDFEDIRTEEWTPSYAGASSRMDFLLKNEKIIIEIKKTRNGLSNKEIGEQLIVDIVKYQKHPDCEKLICFVYDPEGRISNPEGIENDLSRIENDLTVKVYIYPKGF